MNFEFKVQAAATQRNIVFVKNLQMVFMENYTGIVTASGQYIPIEKKQLAEKQLPSEFLLQQNSPNPFNPSTTIRYEITDEGFVSLTVFDNLGREVAELYNGYRKPGVYEATFNAGKLSSGLYFYKIKAGSFMSIKKMLLLK